MMFPGLNDSEAQALVETARKIGANPQHLWELINFESGHDPKKVNRKSGARGLIQFMPDTAVAMGFPGGSIELIGRYPKYEDQMRGPVVQYFTRLAPVSQSYTTRQTLYMKVFLPAAMYVKPETSYVSLLQGKKKWSEAMLAKFKDQNPGINTVADYINFVLRNALKPALRLKVKEVIADMKSAPGSAKAGSILLLCVGAFFLFKKS